LIIATSNFIKIPELLVEKDYWITYILKAISKTDYKEIIVFKGGTSLSKVYKLIDRFSEDIDLSLLQIEYKSEHQIKRLIRNIEKIIIKTPLSEIPDHLQTSKGSRIRKSVWEYPSFYDDNLISPTIILEINSFSNPFPYIKKEVSCYLHEFLNQKKHFDIIEKYELLPFNVNVLNYKRTFCEKISALARASYSGELENKIRHLYDIYKLMQIDEIKNFVNSIEFYELLDKVKSDDLKHEKFNKEWAKGNFISAPIFNYNKYQIKKLNKIFFRKV